MNKHKLNQNEMEIIAHFITQRCVTVDKSKPNDSLEEYLTLYDRFINEMELYNQTKD